jgi:U32 family peptidase
MEPAPKEITAPPAILAPAGNRPAFLAALAAGADAVYCGLKILNARMEAVNFSVEELVPLVGLAHERGVKVHIALNSLLKPDEIPQAWDLMDRLQRLVKPDALIIQDLAYARLAGQAGFTGELHLSTLANVSFSRALALVHRRSHIDCVVLPRELNVDEIKAMAAGCPQGLGLEVFVHGALCFAVSGRCYWSSYMGGKSGLRGRCVQPCRRRYSLSGQSGRHFSCQDLSLDVLTKVLLGIPEIRVWKIEGRRKGPHYVHYTVTAYRMLRDEGRDPQARKAALQLLERALGRPGTHYNFLPQRPQQAVDPARQTGSGLLIGKCQGPRNKPYITPREDLLPGDLLRIGYEDDPWHQLHRMRQSVPKRGRYILRTERGKAPESGTPVFLADRLEKELADQIASLETLLAPPPSPEPGSRRPPSLPRSRSKRPAPRELTVSRHLHRKSDDRLTGVWLSAETARGVSKALAKRIFWWLPPVVWPEDEATLAALIERIIQSGGRHFVLNAPWQLALFTDAAPLDLWAGPFCQIANPLALDELRMLGFSGAMPSPELGAKELLSLPGCSRLPLGIVVAGHWPLCISRGVSGTAKHNTAYISPRGEAAWAVRYGSDNWLYPNWKIDLMPKKEELGRAGYALFVHLEEPVPKGISLKQRPGLWNWDVGLK